MKRIKNLFVAGLIALTVIITFAVCNNPAGRGAAASVTYSGTTTEGETYTLVIYENGSRAVYTPRSGDRYELTITPSNRRSVGVVENTDGTSLTLKPSTEGAQPFTVTVSAAEGGSGHITGITGTVTLEGGETIAGSGIVIPGTGIDEGGEDEGEGTGGESGEGGDTNTGSGNTGGGVRFATVTDITGVPATAAVGVPLTLTGTVAPTYATNKTIVWTVKDAGTTGATISGNILTVTALGDATVTATIANGRGLSFPFTKDFTITVPFVAVESFQGGPWTGVVAEVGESLTLNIIGVRPVDASDQTITWTVKDPGTTGATISGNVLTATALGDVVVTGTVANGTAVGTPYIQDWTIRVMGPLVEHGDFVTRDIQGGGVELAKYLGNGPNVVVPADLGITVLGSLSLVAETITSVVVPEGVTKIDGAFWDSYSLTSITVLAVAPPIGGDSLFMGDGKNLPLLTAIYVPAASVNAYKDANGWKKHADIIQAIPAP